MARIIILDENTSNQIAAGEVIERPASVVKELVENSIDAGADAISIEISRGGIAMIRITDNGSGIPTEDVEMAFERHGTSKIHSSQDLSVIRTMGFRGEALPSIASVSKVEMVTSDNNESKGVLLKLEGGEVTDLRDSAREQGTTVTVRELFYNTPARYKFLKNDTTEARYCTDIVSRLALAHPDINFKYISSGNEVIRTPGDNNLKNAVFCVYGREISKNLFEVVYDDGTYSITGYAGNRAVSRGNRQYQTVFVNGRYVRSPEVSKAVERAYETEIMKGKFPFFILDIRMNPAIVDVNVHPAKSEVRFAKSGEVFQAVHTAVKGALDSGRGMAAGIPDRRKDLGQSNAYAAYNPEGEQESIRVKDFKKEEKFDSGRADPFHRALKETRDMFYKMPQKEEAEKENNFTGHEEDGSKEPERDIDILENAQYSGVLFDTFLIMSISRDEIVLIDQHAAHERINYEKLLSKYKNRKMESQVLLSPLAIGLSQQEAIYADENRRLLEEVGFSYDFIGSSDVALRSIPADLSKSDPEGIFRAALDRLHMNKGQNKDFLEEEVLYGMACKSSVKANTKLARAEIDSLIKQLGKLDNPYTCPHGRPLAVKLERRELEKLFKRIV